jgi:hypothetical protein
LGKGEAVALVSSILNVQWAWWYQAPLSGFRRCITGRSDVSCKIFVYVLAEEENCLLITKKFLFFPLDFGILSQLF